MAEDPFEPRRLIVVYMGSVHPVGRRLSMGSYGSKYTKLCHQIMLTSPSQPGQDGFFSSVGPMCRSARDMRLFLEAVLGANPALLDPDVLPVPLKVPDLTKRKLRVGIMMHDGVVMPHPPIIRALKWAKAKLEASSEVEVVDYTPYDHDRGYSIVVSLVICKAMLLLTCV